ncbi:uncharacterized protein PFL1_02366 [Pseudozyma flocculosa PF-1]|uniref:Uncharacterized protein n=1 Tax=Pseudozyma flocculosa TaxID=84751 RepID=A0A5C3F5N9_9BASI|nr:uncharacterized protein PFL1_02366 [Pseudozyma flocculosa PF-1]EPQ30250.1 hypothetical protein PFL1_02366 [Pseudozyma flocculosa PF-1]SPO39814.1 uncharacterized protein PSFLO_05295 [Pseudozyma flocculosa]
MTKMAVPLPDEIIDDILRLACTLPPVHDHTHREPPQDEADKIRVQSSAPNLDIPTTLKLLCLSPQHYPFIAAILYKGPRLSDPISLSLFARTLATRPALGRLVKHLWVGHAYVGEKLPINALNFGLGGCQAAYALNDTIATIGDVRKCLAQGIPPTNILSPAFEKRIAQWAAFHVHGNSRTIDPLRAPRGIHIDAPGSGDPDSRGYHWIGVDEWMLRLWDGRDLVVELREVALRAWWLELQRLQRRQARSSSSSPQRQPSPSSASNLGASTVTTMLDGDLTAPFGPKGAAERRPGTEGDPLDWSNASTPPEPETPRPPDATLNDDQPVYSESLDLDEIDLERDRCFAEMGVKKPAWSSQSWSEMATVGDKKVEWWLVWLIAKSRARGRIVARRVWQAAQREGGGHLAWKAVLPPASLNTKNHFTHPTLFARSGASHLLVGGAPPSDRGDVWNGERESDIDALSSSDESESELEFESDDSDVESDAGEERLGPIANRATRSRRTGRGSRSLPLFGESELQKSEDQADLWGGGNNYANGNERAGAGNSVIGSRGGMFGYSSALRRGDLDEPDEGLDDGTGFSTKLRERTRRRNEEDRLLSEMTLGSVLSSLRTVLTLAPKLRNLALDGVFERAVCGRRPMVGMVKLKSLSLGPPPPYWSSPLLFGHPIYQSKRELVQRHHDRMARESRGDAAGRGSTSVFPIPGILIPAPFFATLRTLHISGCMLFATEARAIGSFGGQLPNLRHFRWSLWLPHVEGHPFGVVETLCAVMDIPTSEEEAAALASSYKSSGASSSHDTETRKRRRKHDDTFRRRSGASNLSIQDLSLSQTTAAHEASLASLLARKRKLRSVYATLHPIDQAIFARKAPPRLLYDDRLVIETATNENVTDNLREMTRWWEWESDMLPFEPTIKNMARFQRQEAEAAAQATAEAEAGAEAAEVEASQLGDAEAAGGAVEVAAAGAASSA